MPIKSSSPTYDHTIWNTRDPVRSPLVKPDRAGLVVGSVTTSESPVLYVFFAIFCEEFPLCIAPDGIRLGSAPVLASYPSYHFQFQ